MLDNILKSEWLGFWFFIIGVPVVLKVYDKVVDAILGAIEIKSLEKTMKHEHKEYQTRVASGEYFSEQIAEARKADSKWGPAK